LWSGVWRLLVAHLNGLIVGLARWPDAGDKEYRILAHRCRFHGFLKVRDGFHGLVVGREDDKAVADATVLECSALDILHLKAVADA